MHKHRHSNKNVRTTRFSLLLLENGEFYLDDHSACRYLEPDAFTHRKVPGRLKVCTRGLFFVPLELQLPIVRFPFRCMRAEPMTECFLHSSASSEVTLTSIDTALVYVTFQTTQVIEMRERGIDHPYRYRATREGIASDLHTNTSTRTLTDARPAKYIFTLQHVTYEAFLATLHVLFEVATLPRQVVLHSNERTLLAPVFAPRMPDKFDSSLLIDFREKLLVEVGWVVDRIEPLLKFPGWLMLTSLRLYFQPAQLNNVLDPVLNWEYTTIEQVYKRRYLLQEIGLEMYLRNGDSYFFALRSRTERDDVYALIVGQPELQRCRRKDLQRMLQQWQGRGVSNFEYLQFLNHASGRTLNDLTQYPVFPWILRDYTSTELNLNDVNVYRDLSRPIGALNEARLESFRARYDAMPRGEEADGLPPPFLYGTHYSTPGYVLYFLVRRFPEYMLCLQSGKFDAPDRLFRSIQGTWDGCLSNPTDVKELIPEFYDTALPADEWLRNTKHLELGTTQTFDRVDDVELPPWAHESPVEFVLKNRAALESDYVSDHLHHWIDLIFGYKQQGEAAANANNLFYYLSYEGSVDLETIDDPVQKSALESQIQEFGQTPKLLFSSPHPSRNQSEAKIEVATPDLLLSPRILAPQVRKVSNSLNDATVFYFKQRKVIASSAFEENTESENDMEDEKPSHYARNCLWYSLICLQTPWNCLPKALKGLSTPLWGRVRSNKARKDWRWGARLKTKYSLSPTWRWKQISSCRLHKTEVTSTILSSDHSRLVTTSKDKALKFSRPADMRRCRDVPGHFALSCGDLSPDERLVFVGSWDNSVYMHSVSTGLVLDKVVAHSDGISAIRVVHDCFCTSSWDSTIKLWRYTSRLIVPTPLCTFLDCQESVLCLDVSRDGRLGAAGTRNGSVYLFALSAATLSNRVQATSSLKGGVSSIAFAQDNKSYVCVTVLNELVHFNLCGEKLWSMDICTAGQVRSFDSDGNYAVGGTTSGTLLFWKLHEPAGMEVVCELPRAHEASISSLAVSASGSMLVSGAVDGSVNIWKLQKKMPLSRMKDSHAFKWQRTLKDGSSQNTASSSLYLAAQFVQAVDFLEF